MNYDAKLLKEADDYLSGPEPEPLKVAGVGLPAYDHLGLFEWSKRVFDHLEPWEAVGRLDWTEETILADDMCLYLDIEDHLVPMFKKEVAEALIEIYGLEGDE